MKEHVLNPSDRAALQGLIPLAGALGAGTIFALFFGGRRRGSGIAVFELFAIVAVLVSVGTTAYLSISLLHANEAIGDKVLTQTAMPLIFAVFLLVLISVLSRLPRRADRLLSVLPLVLIAGFVAAWLASSSWSFKPGDTVLMAGLVLGVGGVTALVAWGADRLDSRFERGLARDRFVRLSRAGYRVAERDLLIGLPGAKSRGGNHGISCWLRKDRVYLDAIALRRLREQARTRWDRMGEGRAKPPSGPRVLARVSVSVAAPALLRPRSARLWTFEPDRDDEFRTDDLSANDDGLFDVTELGIV